MAGVCRIDRDAFEADFFCGMDANDGPVDVWAVEGVVVDDLRETPEGFLYLFEPIPADRLTLWARDRRPDRQESRADDSGAYQSTLTITFDDEQ